MKKIVLIIALLLIMNMTGSFQVVAQQQSSETERVEMADLFRKEGKIYVVVSIIGVVLTGLIAYAIRIDRKIGRLEEEFEKKAQ